MHYSKRFQRDFKLLTFMTCIKLREEEGSWTGKYAGLHKAKKKMKMAFQRGLSISFKNTRMSKTLK